MCGIAGIIRLGSRPLPPPAVLARMQRALGHRGPDQAATWRDAHMGMVAVRLAVIDPAHGEQPVHGCDGNAVHAVFNGEIYNHVELRGDLREHKLGDNCDTTCAATSL